MLRFMLAGFIVLSVSFVANLWTYETALISNNQINTLVGKANPKFKCAELCTNPESVCVSNGTTCGAGNNAIHCGDYVTHKNSHKGCVEDAAGGVDPCVNDTNDNCYRIKPCACTFTVQAGTIIYGCVVPANAKIQDGGAVVKSSNC